jgi:Domain of unknown function (DUF4177)
MGGVSTGAIRAVVPRLVAGAWQPVAMRRYEYRVLQLRESLIGGKLSADKLEKLLNEEASQGWQLKAITSTEVKGRIGPGGVEGLLITFERPAD